jgi:protein SCO1/2
MNARRKALAFLGINAAAIAAATLRSPLAAAEPSAPADVANTTAQQAQMKRFFPNVPLRTHEGTAVRFYDDLVKGKKVIINFTYTNCAVSCPLTTSNLARVQEILGERIGKDIFIVSLSLDPDNDTPEVLKAYAESFSARPGWTFATGRREDIDNIRRRLGLYDNPDYTQHMGLLTFGNEPEGRWAATPALDTPKNIVRNVLRRIDRFKHTPWPARTPASE